MSDTLVPIDDLTAIQIASICDHSIWKLTYRFWARLKIQDD